MSAIRCSCVLALILIVARQSPDSSAAPPAEVQIDPYAAGVQAYFSGNSAAAEQWFAEAIGRNLKDPRPVYFRGLCLLQQGRRDEAQSDFAIAASLEARAPRAFHVGQSLERVQGADRLLLEKFRWQARSGRPAIVDHAAPSIGVTSSAPAQRAPRQQRAVPRDNAVHPASLTELIDAPTSTSADTNPFADDPRATPGKIPSGKLIGIVGHALMQSAPVPSLDAFRDRIPVDIPVAESEGSTTQPELDFDADTVISSDQDPFAEPAASGTEFDDAGSELNPPSATPPSEIEPAPAETEEDPFG